MTILTSPNQTLDRRRRRGLSQIPYQESMASPDPDDFRVSAPLRRPGRVESRDICRDCRDICTKCRHISRVAAIGRQADLLLDVWTMPVGIWTESMGERSPLHRGNGNPRDASLAMVSPALDLGLDLAEI